MTDAMTWEHLLCADRPRTSSLKSDHREEFERDFDRATFSTPVKRLKDKAQVFPLESHDAVRTRLTHSMEVSAVARGLARGVSKWLLEKGHIHPGIDRQIEAVAATCGLIHDLGNPPFGHAGEDAIRGWFKQREADLRAQLAGSEQSIQDLLKFDGNAQTIRLVSKLQILADFNGLNLTYGTLSASCKYTSASHECTKDDDSRKKPGHFASENELVSEIRQRSGTDDRRNPITFLMEAADDVVYLVADIEDGIKKGIISWREVKEMLRKGSASAKRTTRDVFVRMDAILKSGRDKVPDNLANDVYGSAFRTASLSVLIPDAINTFKKNYAAIMNGRLKKSLTSCGKHADFARRLKDIGVERIYCTKPTLKLELMGQRIIHDLMDVFWNGAKELNPGTLVPTNTFAGRATHLISSNYREVFSHYAATGPSLQYHRYLLVTDQVCGMTDSYAQQLHSELMNGRQQ